MRLFAICQKPGKYNVFYVIDQKQHQHPHDALAEMCHLTKVTMGPRMYGTEIINLCVVSEI